MIVHRTVSATRTGRNQRRRLAGLAALCATVALLVGCSVTYDPTPVPEPQATEEPEPGSGGGAESCENPTASYDPEDGENQTGSTVAAIKKRGRLIAGVSADTYLLGSRNPLNGKIEGFDIDMVKAMTEAILGDPNRYELRVITAADRIPLLQSGDVDVVVRNMTITCERWEEVAFSSEYYRSGQKVLVRKGSEATSLVDLSGERVCAPNATSSMENLLRLAPDAVPVGAENHTSCLVMFQQGTVDAITGDDTVLAGLAAQDPYAEVPEQEAVTEEPYGIGVSLDHPGLVRVINKELAQMRSDGRWTTIYNRWLRDSLGKAPSPPKAEYGRTP